MKLIEFLEGLQEAELYICFANRHYPIVKVPTKLQLVLEELDEHKQDLSTYVEKLDLEGEELAQMQHDIAANANGIFLWVVRVAELLQRAFKEPDSTACRQDYARCPKVWQNSPSPSSSGMMSIRTSSCSVCGGFCTLGDHCLSENGILR